MSKYIQNVTLLFLLKDDQILLAMKKRGFGMGLWNGVGGKQEIGESIEDAAKRECYEEIGVKPQQIELVANLNFYFEENKDGISLVHDASVFICKKWSGEPVETEEMRPKWFSFKEVPYENMWSDDILWLPEIIDGEKLSGEFYFDEDNVLTEHEIKII